MGTGCKPGGVGFVSESMRRILTLAGLWAALLLPFLAQAAEKPNVIVIFIDDMGWGDWSCFGNTEAKTPNFDRLAAEGLRFEQFYVNAPICSPSRCALTTGQYPQRWRITSFLNHRADNARRGVADWLDPQAPTLARSLKAAGYATGHFGKWHLGGQRDVDNAPPISAYGFDETLTNFEGMGAKLLPLTLKPGETEPGRIWGDAERLGGPVVWMQRSEITRGFVDAALPFMNRAVAAGKPFYVNLWPDDVHGPWWPPVEKWAEGKRAMYLAVLESMDRQFGRLFEHVRSRPELRDNTLILAMSDNGPEAGAGSAGPFRGGKTTLYEGGTRSPLIVWGPGWIDAARAGSVNRESVLAAFDLAPTLMALAGVSAAPGGGLDGEALPEVLLGKSTGSRKAPLFWRRPPDRKTASAQSPERLPDLAMRVGRWKLLCEYDGSGAQLYDVVEDRAESRDRSGEQPQRVAEMKARLLAWHAAMPADNGPALGEQAPHEPTAPKAKPKGKGAGKAARAP